MFHDNMIATYLNLFEMCQRRESLEAHVKMVIEILHSTRELGMIKDQIDASFQALDRRSLEKCLMRIEEGENILLDSAQLMLEAIKKRTPEGRRAVPTIVDEATEQPEHPQS